MKKSLFFSSHIQNVQPSLFEIIKDHITVLAGIACTLFSGDPCNKATGTSGFDFQVNPSADNNPEKLTGTTTRRTLITYALNLIN